ncbi:MAG TPA: ABC transporter substrate-binding protein [Candidatus Blautia excrementipullorum]|nr:ABC transporter substrate-binding protein [Candidatus Blautia excrementipullorum]
MKKSIRKFLGIVLSASMIAVLLTGCGGGNSNTDTAEETSTEGTSGDSSDTIKIGWYGPLSGSAASVGTTGDQAARLAVKQVNEAGGVLGKQVELIEYDDEGVTETSVRNVTRLIEQDNVVGIVGSHLSAAVLATSDINEEAHVVQFGTGTSEIWTNIGLSYTFRPTVCSALFNQACYDSMVTMGATKIATISAETEYAQTATATVVNLIEEGGVMEVVDQEGYTSGDTDFSGQVTKILASGADGVLLNGGGEDLGKIVRALRMQGYEGYIYGIESLADQQTLELAGDYADGVIFSCCYFVPQSVDDALTDAEHDFLVAFQEEYGELPVSEVAYRAYDGMNILLQAIELAGSTDGDDIREAILSNTFTGIAGEFDFSDGSGEGITSGTTYVIDKGKIVTFDSYLEEIQ